MCVTTVSEVCYTILMANVTEHDISEYTPDPANANAGTERGVYMLDTSLEQFGAGRSALADRDGILIAGNKTVERAAEHGIRKVIEVETDGTELVVVKRRDLSLLDDTEHKARGLAYADNRAGEVGLAWDAEQLLADVNAGVALDTFWKPEELEELLQGWGDAFSGVPSGDKPPFQQMTFTLHDSQVPTVQKALKAAMAGLGGDSPNANSNGNALARICEAYNE